MSSRAHEPTCTLYSAYWLRHAVAAAGRLAQPIGDPDDEFADKKAAQLLADTLAHFAEMDDWESVTLLDIAEHSNPIPDDDRFDPHCTCKPTS